MNKEYDFVFINTSNNFIMVINTVHNCTHKEFLSGLHMIWAHITTYLISKNNSYWRLCILSISLFWHCL
jgi:hypothetical protein